MYFYTSYNEINEAYRTKPNTIVNPFYVVLATIYKEPFIYYFQKSY